MTHDVWVEVDLAALRHNLSQVRKAVGDQVQIMAVVKANGYGHGYVEPAKAFVQAGADAVAVTRIEEATKLRQAGIAAPVLLLAPIQAANAVEAVETDLSFTVTTVSLAQAISDAATRLDRTAQVHIKIDTGMGRLGVVPNEAAGFIQSVAALPRLSIAGVFTHLATAADADCSSAQAQLRVFTGVLDDLSKRGIDYGIAHAANSAAILRLPEARLEMVRPGTLLFGQYPSKHVPRTLDLRSAFKLKARVCELKSLPPRAAVGYGGEFRTSRETRTAVVAIGWADGYTLAPEGPVYRQSVVGFAARKLRRNIWAEVRGRTVPVLGRVAAQMTILDITNVPGVEAGDEVTLPAMRVPVSPLIPRVYLD